MRHVSHSILAICCGALLSGCVTPEPPRSSRSTLGGQTRPVFIQPSVAAPRPGLALSEVARRLGMKVTIDLIAGKRTLSRGQDKISINPGKDRALVNGQICTISAAVMWRGGVLMAPQDLPTQLAAELARYPAPKPAPKRTWKAASYKRPVVAKVGPTPQLPRSWNQRANRHWRYIVIHHSATRSGGAKAFNRHHARKWRYGLGYHFVVGNGSDTRLGQVEVGSRWTRQNEGIHGAHAGSRRYNEHGIGICLVGDFQRKGPGAAQLKALRKLCHALMRRYRISSKNVLRHSQVRRGHTDCPGKRFPWASFKRSL